MHNLLLLQTTVNNELLILFSSYELYKKDEVITMEEVNKCFNLFNCTIIILPI